MQTNLDFIKRQRTQAGFSLIPICKGLKYPPKGFPLAKALRFLLSDEELLPHIEGDVDLAVVCGEVSNNLFVVDLDEKVPFSVPTTLKSKTRRGFHFYFRASPLPLSRSLFLSGLKVGDLLAAGRTCKVPPSSFAGGNYTWVTRTPPVTLSSVDLSKLLACFDPPPPPYLPPPSGRLEIIHPDRYLLAKIRGEIGNMESAANGTRNKVLVNCCVKLKEIEKELWQPHLTAAALRVGLTLAEINAVFVWLKKIT